MNEFHFFQVNNKDYAYDTNTSFVFELNSLTKELLNQNNKCLNNNIETLYNGKKALKAIDYLKFLSKTGYICSNQIYKSNIGRDVFKITGITLFVTEKCNLNCVYCYEKTIVDRKHMNKQVARNAIEKMKNYSSPYDKLYISFFGGEPLLNIELIEWIVQYCKDIDIYERTSFSMTTNGTILNNNFIELAVQNNIKVLVSLDGLEGIQNHNRPFINGEATFNVIEKNIKKLKDKITLRVNTVLSHQNIDYLNTYKYLKELKIIEHVVTIASTSENQYQITVEEANKILLDSENVTKIFIDDILNGDRFTVPSFMHYAKQLYPNLKKKYYCSAGIDGFSVLPSGEVYPCHRYSNDKSYSLGNINQFVPGNKTEYIRLKTFKCDECWAKDLCHGGCMHENNEICSKYGNDIICTIRKRWCELALAAYSEIALKCPEKLSVIVGKHNTNNCRIRYININNL